MKILPYLLAFLVCLGFVHALTEYTAYTEKTCEAGICSLTMYGGQVFDYDGGQWNRMVDVTSLDWTGTAFRFSYKDRYSVDIEPYFIYNGNERTLAEAKALYPSLSYSLNKETFDEMHKFAPSVSGIPSGLNNSNLKFGFRLSGSQGLTWDDVRREGNGIVIKDRFFLSFEDLVGSGFTLESLNKTHVVVGNVPANNKGGTVVLDPSIFLNATNGGLLQDTYVWQQNPTVQYGDVATYLVAEYDSTNLIDVYWMWNISNISGSYHVVNAFLNYTASMLNNPLSENYNYTWHLVYNNYTVGGTDSWCEGGAAAPTCGMTWNNRPKGAGYVYNDNSSIDFLVSTDYAGYNSFNVTEFAQFALDEGYNVTTFMGHIRPTDGSPQGTTFQYRIRPKEYATPNSRFQIIYVPTTGPGISWVYHATALDNDTGIVNVSDNYVLNVTQVYPANANRWMTHGTAALYINNVYVGSGSQGLDGVNGTGFLMYDLNASINVSGIIPYYWNVTAYFNDSTTETDLISNGSMNISGQSLLNVTIKDQATLSLITQNVTIIVGQGGPTYTFWTTSGYKVMSLPLDGSVTVRVSSTGYSTAQYVTTLTLGQQQNLTVYLVNSSNTVTFTFRDQAALIIENVTVKMEAASDEGYIEIGTRDTDITGRVQFSYIPNIAYRFTATKDGYVVKTFILDPIQFDSYIVRMTRTTAVTDGQDYYGVRMAINLKQFYDAVQNNLSLSFYSPEGFLTAYAYNVTYPGGSKSVSGSSATGGTLWTNFTPSGSGIFDKVVIRYSYTTSLGDTRQFSSSYDIIVAPKNTTIAAMKYNLEFQSMGDFERILIAVFASIVIAGGFALLGGEVGGLVGGLLGLAFFAGIGFITFWMIAVAVVVGLLYIAWRSTS